MPEKPQYHPPVVATPCDARHDEEALQSTARYHAVPASPATRPLERFAVPIVFITFVIMRAMDRVFAKRVSDRMKDYQVSPCPPIVPGSQQDAAVSCCT